MSNKPKVIAVVGPTASGKTALSIRLAKDLDGEIISMDSMQIYRGMDIGTAKPTEEERDGIPHHMIDIAEPYEEFSSADYASMAQKCADEIISRGKTPILCGGTGLYLDSFMRGDDNNGGGADPEYRAQMTRVAEENGAEYVHELLRKVDPDSADKIHPNNVKRVIRALEIFHVTGMQKSELDRISLERECKYSVIVVGLRYSERDKLYQRIDTRVDIMVEQGLLNEAKLLYSDPRFAESKTASQAIGYKELRGYVEGSVPLELCIEELKRATRRYAKRQMTWFNARDYVRWIDMDTNELTDENGEKKQKTFEDIVNIAKKLLAEF